MMMMIMMMLTMMKESSEIDTVSYFRQQRATRNIQLQPGTAQRAAGLPMNHENEVNGENGF